MKLLIPILGVLVFLGCKRSNTKSPDSLVFNHVDSLIVEVLKYEYNEDSYKYPEQSGTGERASIVVSKNPEPFILLDGVPIKKDELKILQFKDVKEYLVIPKDAAQALYGSRGKNGAVVLISK